MDDLPTPEELGERLKAGEITKEEAIEIMSERARREALAGLFSPAAPRAGDSEQGGKAPDTVRRAGTWILVGVIAALILLYILLQMLDR